MGKLLSLIFRTAVGRWAIGALVALTVGTAATLWHTHKENLRAAGRQECVSEIQQATIDALQKELAYKEQAIARLRSVEEATRNALHEANKRRREAEVNLNLYIRSANEQRETDETYREWADSQLPNGVADRLRSAGSTSN